MQAVVVTGDAAAAAVERAGRLGLYVDERLAAPFVLMGTEDEIIAAVQAHQRRWGITIFVVRQEAVDLIAPIIARLPYGADAVIDLAQSRSEFPPHRSHGFRSLRFVASRKKDVRLSYGRAETGYHRQDQGQCASAG